MAKSKALQALTVKVSFDLPFCLYIKDGSYQVQMPSYTATVNVHRKKQKDIDPRLGIEEAANTELVHDRHGRLRYTSIEVTFPGKAAIAREVGRQIYLGKIKTQSPSIQITVDTEDLTSKYWQAAFEEAIVIVNYFITVYREATRAFYIRTLSKEEIYRATINWFDNNEPLGFNEYGGFGKGMVLEPVELSPTVANRFKQRLKVYRLPSLHAELVMNARDYLDQGNHRMAVIEARTCIEVIIDQLLESYFVGAGTDVEAVRKLFDVGKKGTQTIQDVLEKAKVNDKLTKGLKCVTGRSLAEDSKLWADWIKFKDTREGAVHRASEISEIDAKEAINTLYHIIEFISKKTG